MAHIIDTKLQDIGCPVSLFVPIAGIIGRTRLTQALQGEKPLDLTTVERLCAVLDEMAELWQTSLVKPDWTDARGIQKQLAARREFREGLKDDANRVRELLELNDESSSTK